MTIFLKNETQKINSLLIHPMYKGTMHVDDLATPAQLFQSTPASVTAFRISITCAKALQFSPGCEFETLLGRGLG